ncbi:MAG: hypothetical protein LBI85_05505 [Spirochaetaceae bacterium]|nr:hypothetical protein [Spirochaetaceae bacterium]
MFLFSCGIEDYIYLDPIPASNVSHTSGNTLVQVTIPPTPAVYFTHYVIFYRIYVSEVPLTSEITDLGTVSTVNNSTLTSNYNTLRPYADETNTISASQVGTVFNNLLYSELAVSGGNLQTLLGPSGTSRSLAIDFSDSAAYDIPYLTINGGLPYQLRRTWTVRGFSPPSGAPSAFTPLPSGTGYDFTRSQDLCYVNSINNWDISVKSGTDWGSGTGQYAYVSLYIAARGIDGNFNSIYSRPTFLGVLRLPD